MQYSMRDLGGSSGGGDGEVELKMCVCGFGCEGTCYEMSRRGVARSGRGVASGRRVTYLMRRYVFYNTCFTDVSNYCTGYCDKGTHTHGTQ